MAPESRPLAIRDVSYQADFTQGLHWHGATSITLVYQGSLEERVGRTTVCAGPLSMVVKPAGVLHSNRFGPGGAKTLQITLLPTDGALSDPFDQWRWIHEGAVVKRFLSLLRQFRHETDSADLDNTSIDLLAALQGDADDQREDPPPWLLRVKEEVDDTFTESTRVRELARQVGVHPVSLARSFRRHFGTSVTAYLKRLRARAAARSLSDGDEPLAEVALRSGYADQSHLCREFKLQTGLTPGLFRKLVRD